MSEGKKLRMGILKSEEDVERLVEEIQRDQKETHEHTEHEVGVEEADITSLMASAIHMLSHLESHLAEIGSGMKNLELRLQNIEKILGVIARLLLLPEIKNPEFRDKLVKEIVEGLES